jgi:SAM-dependent methyltransferase
MHRAAFKSAVAALFASATLAGPLQAQSPPAAGGGAPMFSRSVGYERYMGRWSRTLVPDYIAFAGVRNGDRVLDVGTGTGAVPAALATRLPASEIVRIDPSDGFIEYAKSNVTYGRTRFEVGDAQSLRFPDATFDQTMALLVMNFVPDHEKAIREMRRVTRPGGTVSACVWDYDAGMEMIRIFWDEVVAFDPSMAPKHQRSMKFARQGELGALWRSAGLTDVREQPLVIEQRFASFDDYWKPFLGQAGAAGSFIRTMGEDKVLQLEERLRKRLQPDGGDGSITLKARAWCVRGQAG